MTNEWYYQKANEVVGPVTGAQLRRLAVRGEIDDDTLIRKGAGTAWTKAHNVKGLFTFTETAQTAANASSTTRKPVETVPNGKSTASDRNSNQNQTSIAQGSYLPSPALNGSSKSKSELHNFQRASGNHKLKIALSCLAVFLTAGFVAVMVYNALQGEDRSDTSNETFDTSDESVDAVLAVETGSTSKLESGQLTSARQSTSAEQQNVKSSSETLRKARILLMPNAIDQYLVTDDDTRINKSALDNVIFAANVLEEYLADPYAESHEEAKTLLNFAKIAMSDEKAMSFILSIEEEKRKQLASESNSYEKYPTVYINLSSFEKLGVGFSNIFPDYEQVQKNGEETVVALRKSESQSSLRNLLYENIQKAAKVYQQNLTEEREQLHHEMELNAVLRDGTPNFNRILTYPENYIFEHVYFDGIFGSRFGNMELDKKSGWFTVAFRCKGKGVLPSNFGLQKEDLNFVVSESIGEQLLDLSDEDYFSRIFCRIRYGDPDLETYPLVVIYRIDFFEDANFDGRPKLTVE